MCPRRCKRMADLATKIENVNEKCFRNSHFLNFKLPHCPFARNMKLCILVSRSKSLAMWPDLSFSSYKHMERYNDDDVILWKSIQNVSNVTTYQRIHHNFLLIHTFKWLSARRSEEEGVRLCGQLHIEIGTIGMFEVGIRWGVWELNQWNIPAFTAWKLKRLILCKFNLVYVHKRRTESNWTPTWCFFEIECDNEAFEFEGHLRLVVIIAYTWKWSNAWVKRSMDAFGCKIPERSG